MIQYDENNNHYEKTYEFEDLRHLDLREDTAVLVLAEVGRVTNSKGVRTLDRDFARLTTVQFSHALNFSERYEVTIFKTMSGLIQAGDQTFAVL